jgi:hypothetical protein
MPGFRWFSLKEVWGAVIGFLKGIWGAIIGFLKGIWGAIIGFLKAIWEAISSFLRNVGHAFECVFEKLGEASEWLFGNIADGSEWLLEKVSNAFRWLLGWFPLKEDRKAFQNELEERYENPEDRFKYLNDAGLRLIHKAIGLLTYDALLVALCTIPIAGLQELSLPGAIGVCLAVISAVLTMIFAFLVHWPYPGGLRTAQREFVDYVTEVGRRTFAINVSVVLSFFATLSMLARVLGRL